MIYWVVGATSPRFMLVARLTRFLVEQAHGPTLVCDANSAESLKAGLSNRNGAPCLICSDCPEEILAQLIVRTRLPAILVAEPFDELHAFSACQYDLEFYPALREVTRKLSSMHTLAGVPNVAVIRFSEDDKLLWLLSRIASFLDLPVSEEQLQEALDAHRDPLDPNQTVLRACRVVYDSSEKMRTYARNYTIEERDIIQTLGKSYEPLLIDPYIDTIHWPIEALVNAETGSPLSSPIELLGPARIISYGPYLYVPRGRWLITLTFDVRDNHSGARLMIDIYTPGLDRVLVAAKGEIPLSGAFSTSMDFEIDSSLHAIEIRLYSQVGAIEGVIEVLDISLQKQAEI